MAVIVHDSWEEDTWSDDENIIAQRKAIANLKPVVYLSWEDDSVIEPPTQEPQQESYESEDEQAPEQAQAQRTGGMRKHEARTRLCNTIYNLLKDDYSRFKDYPVSSQPGKKNINVSDLITQEYFLPVYGYIAVTLKKAEVYYSRNTKKYNISKLRAEIDATQTQLRIAIAKDDDRQQEKIANRLLDQKKQYDHAMEEVTKIREKNTSYDNVLRAINLIKKKNSESSKFCDMLRTLISKESQPTQVQTVKPVQQQVQTTVITAPPKNTSIFAKKSIVFNK